MTETTLFPQAIQLPKGRIDQEQLIPSFVPSKRAGFVGLKSGRIHHHGLLASLEKPLDPEKILATFAEHHPLPLAKKECLKILDRYLQALQAFKAGNVIFIRYSKTGEFSISKVLESPPAERFP